MGDKVSVIVSHYNKSEYLEECVRSVVNQTYENLELIVVDDGSDYLRVPARWEKLLLRVGHRGQSGARNAGVLNSTGDFILPLDADDWIDPTYLEKTVPLCTENGVGVVSTGMQRFGLQHEYLPAESQTIDSEKNYNNIPCCSLIKREAFLQTGGYNSRVDGYEDWNLWIDILKRGWKHAVINEPLFHYRVLGNAANARADERRQELIDTIHAIHPEIY